MSIIGRLGEEFKNLPAILAEYESVFDPDPITGTTDVEDRIRIKGKNLEAANTEQAPWHYYYEVRKVELHTLLKFFEGQVAAVRGRLFKKMSSYQHELSDRQKEKFIDNEQKYLDKLEIYLEIKEVYEKYEAICNAFTSRGYALNNITKIRVASQEDVVI